MIVGIDFSTKAVDIVGLAEDTDTATHTQRRLIGARALDRARRVRDALPARGAYHDAGATVIAIEQPFHHSHQALSPLMMVLGAILATVPPDVPLWLIRADDWRHELGMPRRAPREVHKRNAIEFATARWADRPARVDDNCAEAFCIAWAARELDRRREAAAA